MQFEILEFEKIATVVTVITATCSMIISLYLTYTNFKKEKFLTIEEMSFILSRGEKDDHLNTQTTLLREKQLIEKAFGFPATREEFNNLLFYIPPAKFDRSKLRTIKSYLSFQDDKPIVQINGTHRFLFILNIIFVVGIGIIALVSFWVYRQFMLSNFILIGCFAIMQIPNILIIYPYQLAKKVAKILGEVNL
ncbi:hypothetical protein [Labilibaculum euxinus]